MKENVLILKLNMVFFLKNKNLNLNSYMWEVICRFDCYFFKYLVFLSGLKWNVSSNVYWGNKIENKCLIMIEFIEVKGFYLFFVEFII